MAQVTDFDELNIIREYFEPMGIGKADRERRITKAIECYGDFIVMLYLVLAYEERGMTIPWVSIGVDIRKKLGRTFNDISQDGRIREILDSVSTDFADVTARRYTTPYFTSEERAVNLAVNTAEAILNYDDFRTASADGKKYKTWHSLMDGKERATHHDAHGQRKPIDGLFTVGEAIMRFPMDTLYDPPAEEICGCRCWCTYT